MNRPHYYDRAGQPMTLMEWATAFEGNNSVARDEIGGLALEIDWWWWEAKLAIRKPRRVSTVWLGLDHQWGDGPPLIFETMVFPDEDQWRYSTEKEALAHHAEVVRFYRRWWWTMPLRNAVAFVRDSWRWCVRKTRRA